MPAFLQAADAWICPEYSLDFRYITKRNADKYEIWDASLALNPLPAKADLNFRIEPAGFGIGQIQDVVRDTDALLRLLSEATAGTVTLSERLFALPHDQPLVFNSEMHHRERWFSDLHLQVSGVGSSVPPTAELANVDNALRLAQPPFDGLSDVASWLGLRAPRPPRAITIRVSPPVDLIFDRCSLADNTLRLTLHAHPRFDVSRVGLSLRAVPGNALAGRLHAAKELTWGDVRDGRHEGTAEIQLHNADSVLVMLMIGNSTVRRQWFLDSQKARNSRLLATQLFDRDMRMVRHALLDATDAAKFEQGVASLLFLLGFSAAVQLETDAPDLIVTTPAGRLVIVECTTRVADFAGKVGKLVDRRGALSKHLAATGHPSPVTSVLVCRLPRDQIAAHTDQLLAHNIILIAGGDISAAFDRLRFPIDPDKILDEVLARLTDGNSLG